MVQSKLSSIPHMDSNFIHFFDTGAGFAILGVMFRNLKKNEQEYIRMVCTVTLRDTAF